MKVYLDNCCYNRLFDDRSNIKNYLEREAVLIVMQKVFDHELDIIGSDILEIEMSKIKNKEKRSDVQGIYHSLITNFSRGNLRDRAASYSDKGNFRYKKF